MIEKYSTLEVTGRKFAHPTPFDFFQSKNKRIALVFGRNGAGKSTIADAFRLGTEASGDVTDLSAQLKGPNETPIALSGVTSTSPCTIHVFDERFANKYCRFVGNGLKTIVLMGSAGGLYDDVVAIKNQIKDNAAELKRARVNWSARLDKHKKSPSDLAIREIETQLKNDNGWLGRETLIRAKKPQLKSEIKQAIFDHQETRTKTEVEQLFNEKLNALTVARQSATEDFSKWPVLNAPTGVQAAVNDFYEMMTRIVNRPTTTEMTSRVFEILQERHQDWVHDARSTFSSEIDYCPFCARSITSAEKTEIISHIDNVLNREAIDFADNLKNIPLNNIPEPPIQYQRLDKDAWIRISNYTREVNEILTYYRNCRDQRLENVYEQVAVESRNLTEPLGLLTTEIDAMRLRHSQVVENLRAEAQLIKELSDLNIELSHHEIKEAYSSYKSLKEIDDVLQGEIIRLEDNERELNQQKQNRMAALAQVEIAEDEVNTYLSRVFLSRKRISIHHENGEYALKVNDRNVNLSQVSTGERNIIALCYFFAHIMKDDSVSGFMAAEHLIVLDDPISSFDADVRMGVLALLNDRVRALLAENTMTRVLLMTHDYHAFYELFIAFKLRFENVLALRELRDDGKVDTANIDQFNEYILILKQIYKFAKGEPLQLKFVLGNMMRRILEAFSTFQYKSGFETLFDSPRATEKLNGYANYFSVNMTRFVANDESHAFSHVRELIGGIAMVDTLSDLERHRAAKDVICILHLYDPFHIKSYLSDFNDLDANITSWLEEIKDHA